MNNPLHAAHYADGAGCHTVPIVENTSIAHDTYRLRFHCPEIARRIVPGQFLMLRLSGCDDPLIGRPLALYDTIDDETGTPAWIDVVYLVKGKLTTRLATIQPGQSVDVWGPLGNGFFPRRCEHLIMVAGGIGQTPFLALTQEYLGDRRYGDRRHGEPAARRISLCYGARSRAFLAGVEDFQRVGAEVRLATDDGTLGHHGLVTDVFRQVLHDTDGEDRRAVCCGPEPMMETVAQIASEANVPCEVSLETPMACGIGICFSCVARVKDGSGQWDYQRTCVEGPVFDASMIAWTD